MLIVVIPVIVMAIVFPWRYRASNTKATYSPNWSHSGRIEAVVWLVPCVIVAGLATVTWISTHDLDPYKPIAPTVATAANGKPIEVQVVSLDWKWLFIYPSLNIATVNELAFPAGTPVHFSLTSGTVMNSFFIPQLGSQIYTMSGMQTQLSLLANEPGDYQGMSANYSGGGFSDMTFQARAMTDSDFAAWVQKVRASQQTLTPTVYRNLEQPTEKMPVTYYSTVGPNVFHDALNKCADGAMCTDDAMKLSMASDALGTNVGLCSVPQKKVID
jgi:cytochrome o ubiquinol oxidase subunit 2